MKWPFETAINNTYNFAHLQTGQQPQNTIFFRNAGDFPA